ncbi:MAG: hypothetical protein KJ634_09505 [Gammaproteobacteria bacterium]|nr:hypothetical protein [Gammaproteobacteria bacterium]MBU1415844.1 hypothetical protein [Gammaproteobacteria bacterium]
MNVTTSDFIRIRWALGFLVLATLIGYALATTSRKLTEAAQADQFRLQAQQRDIRARLNRAPEEEQELRSKIALYQELQQRGIIGQEERLDWVEQIGRIKAERRLLDVQYEIAAQKSVDSALLPAGAMAGEYEFMSSTMNLQMPLLHEDDLLGFLDDLRKSVHAQLLVRECAIDRLPPGADRRVAAQLRATCTIDWITLREKRQ